MIMKLIPSSLFLFYKKKELWQYWPSCKNPKTLNEDLILKAVNSLCFDPNFSQKVNTTFFSNSSESVSDSEPEEDECCLERIIRGARSDRLFFEPGVSSMVESQENIENCKPVGLKESVAVGVKSYDPYRDFKKSMEEMVESSGLKDWESLEELLRWYLRMNAEKNHGFIFEAFVDLLVGGCSGGSGESSGASCSHHSFTSALSSPANPHHLTMEED